MIMAGETGVTTIMLHHLQELMEDAEAYGWKSVHSYHPAWLQQLVQGWTSLADEDKKLKLRRALVWHRVQESTAIERVSQKMEQGDLIIIKECTL